MSTEKKKKWFEHFVTVSDSSGQESIQHEDEPVTGKSVKAPLEKSVKINDEPVLSSEKADQFVLTSDFSQIYTAAEIEVPAHGYTVYKIMELMDSDDLKSMTPEVKKSAITAALKITNVNINDVIKDAVARDKALDAYENMKLKSIGDFEKRKISENESIQREIEEFLKAKNEQIGINKKNIEDAKSGLAEWQRIKQAEEQKIFDAVTPFVSPNPITLSKPSK